MKFGAIATFLTTVLMSAPTWAFQDFKVACEIPRATPVAQKNFAENTIILKAMDGTNKCWLASFTLKDGAIDTIACQPLESCRDWRKAH